MRNSENKYFLTSLIKSVLSPVILVLITLYLTPVEQGKWYFLVSLGMVVTIADLGYTVSITQALSKIWSTESLADRPKMLGQAKQILSQSFIRTIYVLIFGNTISLLLIKFLPIGTETLRTAPQIAFYMASTSAMFVFIVMASAMEGMKSIHISLNAKILQALAYVVLVWLFLKTGSKHFSYIYALGVSAFLATMYIIITQRHLINQLISSDRSYTEVSVLQNRLSKQYLLSYGAGFVIIQSFVLQASLFLNAKLLGELGMSLGICLAIFSISTSFASNSLPKTNALYDANIQEALSITIRQLKKCCATYIAGVIGFIIFASMISIADISQLRVVGNLDFFLLNIFFLTHTAINSLAIFLRSSGTDPLVKITLLQAITILIFNYVSFSNNTLTISFSVCALTNIGILIWAYNQIRMSTNAV